MPRVQARTGHLVRRRREHPVLGRRAAELRNRGQHDVLIVCCDGLSGLSDAVEATWPKAVAQTCVIHLIRASMRLISYDDRKNPAALRPVYTAVNEAAAKAALE